MAGKTISDVTIYFILGIALFFLSSNFDSTLALIFAIGLFLTWAYYNSDKSHSIVIESRRNLGRTFTYAMAGYFSVIILSAFANNLGFFSVLDVMAEAQASLAFEKSQILMFLSQVFLIATIETSFIAMLIEFFKDRIKLNFEGGILDLFKNPKLLSLFAVIAAGFMYLHSTAKGIENTPALVTVLIFGFVTCVVIYLEKQSLGAILMHILANGVALSIAFGYFAIIQSSVLFGLGIVVVLIFLLRYVRIVPRGWRIF